MDVETAIILFKMLSNTTRLKIIKILSENECDYRVADLEHILDIPQPSVSQHLAHLRNSGLLKFQKKGKTICYRISDTVVASMLFHVKLSEEELLRIKQTREEIENVYMK